MCIVFFFQAEDGIRDLVRSRGLGDVYKRQVYGSIGVDVLVISMAIAAVVVAAPIFWTIARELGCLLYTSDAADERSSVDLGGRRIIKKKKKLKAASGDMSHTNTKESVVQRRTQHQRRTTHTLHTTGH